MGSKLPVLCLDVPGSIDAWNTRAAQPVALIPDALRFEDALKIARGCTDYSGGHRSNTDDLKIYHHGIHTVVNALQAASKNGLKEL